MESEVNNFSWVFNGWSEWCIRSLFVVGLSVVTWQAYQVRPWQGLIIDLALKAEGESKEEDPVLDESTMHPRFKTTPKPYAWAKPE